ncbi:MAG: hypothetical protein MMC33_003275 [Icmadophila ericetorum]|nr:hypothetical protein [Icmadophila ericetorum]
MPLHLLGKKSWNVYNVTNIEKVKRDEAAAAAQEAEKEQRMQEVDAERRINILRGLATDVEAPPVPESDSATTRSRRETGSGREAKRRRIAGEDDTERDLRLARDNQERQPEAVEQKRKPSDNTPLTDAAGHINLFPISGSRSHSAKNAEVEAEAAKRKKEYEDQYTMRFSNASGNGQSMNRRPWYYEGRAEPDFAEEVVGRNVWGNEDAGHKERDQRRIVADDPLAVMHKGVCELRQVEKERQEWKEGRDRELTHRRKRKAKGSSDLEGFQLDSTGPPNSEYNLKGRRENGDSTHRHGKRRHSRTRPR